MLEIFALVVLIVLVMAVVGCWVLLAVAPGRIARARNHPQAEAINVCGWWGAITLGILSPLAFIWAYTRSIEPAGSYHGNSHPEGQAGSTATGS